MYVRVRVRQGLADSGLQVRCRQELQRALRAAELRVDWAFFFLEETGAAGPYEPRHRCMLTVGRHGASPHSVEAREQGADAAVRRAVERAAAVLASKAVATPGPEEVPVAEVAPPSCPSS
jgi:hypothetical protein